MVDLAPHVFDAIPDVPIRCRHCAERKGHPIHTLTSKENPAYRNGLAPTRDKHEERRHKVHYVQFRNGVGICGLTGTTTLEANDMTCGICKFRYLAMQTPWAQGFLDELRGRVGRGQPAAVVIPAATAEHVDALVKAAHSKLGRAFAYQRGSQKAISELLPISTSAHGTVEPIMGNGGPPAQPICIQPREIAEQPRDTGEVSYEPRRYNKFSE